MENSGLHMRPSSHPNLALLLFTSYHRSLKRLRNFLSLVPLSLSCHPLSRATFALVPPLLSYHLSSRTTFLLVPPLLSCHPFSRATLPLAPPFLHSSSRTTLFLVPFSIPIGLG